MIGRRTCRIGLIVRLPAVKSVIIVTGFIRRMEKIRLDGDAMTPGQFLYRYAYGDDWFAPTWSDPLDRQDNWSPDLADLADEWASWQEQLEERAEREAELEEYQRQMEAAYVRQQYEDRENEERRRSSWPPVDGGPWW